VLLVASIVAAVLAVVLLWSLHSPEAPPAIAEAQATPSHERVTPAQSPKRPLTVVSMGHTADGGRATGHDVGDALPQDPLRSFGKLVELGQEFTLAEVLAKNAKDADANVDRLCEQSRKLRDQSSGAPPCWSHKKRNSTQLERCNRAESAVPGRPSRYVAAYAFIPAPLIGHPPSRVRLPSGLTSVAGTKIRCPSLSTTRSSLTTMGEFTTLDFSHGLA
jgi:hypothetical protein